MKCQKNKTSSKHKKYNDIFSAEKGAPGNLIGTEESHWRLLFQATGIGDIPEIDVRTETGNIFETDDRKETGVISEIGNNTEIGDIEA